MADMGPESEPALSAGGSPKRAVREVLGAGSTCRGYWHTSHLLGAGCRESILPPACRLLYDGELKVETNFGRPEYSVSTVTCAYTEDRWEDLVAALGSIRLQSRAPNEVILVVDHNTSLLRRAQSSFPDVHIVANSHSRGLSGARNTGGDVAQSDIVAFLDDDAQATQTWLERLVEPFQSVQVAGVGGAALPLWPATRPPWFPPEFDWALGCAYVGLPDTRSSVRNLIGTNMSVRRNVMLSVSGFREGFGMVMSGDEHGSARSRGSTCDDTEFCLRVANSHPGAIWIYEPSAVVFHRVSRARATFRYFVSRCWIEGKGKAALADIAGSSKALASERAYVLRVIPRGIAAGLRDSVKERTLAGVRRSGTLAVGVALVSMSYVANRLLARRRK